VRKLATALLVVGVGMAIATTALAQDGCFYGSCNPEAPWCRLLCGSEPQRLNLRTQVPKWHVAVTHHGRLYMYAHGNNTQQKAALGKAP
jgi:hypothetical protein